MSISLQKGQKVSLTKGVTSICSSSPSPSPVDMPVSLQKGQKVNLTKGNPGLKKVVVGLGWDVLCSGS